MISGTPAPLTPRQRQILDWVGAFTITEGRPPSYREIADGLVIKHHSTAQHHMNSLRALGWVRWDSRPRRSLSLEFFHPDGTWHRTPPPKVL
jgi:SOS-response transcriptional repressor LexA